MAPIDPEVAGGIIVIVRSDPATHRGYIVADSVPRRHSMGSGGHWPSQGT
jgi:hypothetical protein